MSWIDSITPASKADIKRLEKRMASQQEQIDAAVKELGDVKDTLAATQANVATIATGINGLETSVVVLNKQVAALQEANPALDLTGLQNSVSGLKSQVADLKTATDTASADLADGPEETPQPAV